MSTPAEQYIPDEFEDVLDFPEPGIDQAVVTKAQAALAQATGALSTSNAALKTQQSKLASLKKAAAKKGLPSAAKKKYATQIKAQTALVASTQKTITARTAAQTAAQGTVYEASGQYDQLLKGENRDAFMALKSLFGQFGLGSLAPKIYDFVKQGYGADTISVLLQDTKEYKERFAGNEARAKKGMAVLSPQEYLATEAAYRQILSSAGLPIGFYDNPADFRNWISGDVAPTEIQKRVDQAVAWTAQADPSTLQALKSMYGVDSSYVTAYALDRARALPLLQKQARAAEIGAAAIRRGLAASRTDFENLATYGITGEQAEEGFARIKDSYESLQAIAGRFGLNWDYQEAQQEVFTPGVGTGTEKGKRLRSQERALFSGGRGATSQGLNAGYSQT